MPMSEQSYPIPCTSCGKHLYGPVSFCPYCATPSQIAPVKKATTETTSKVAPKVEPTPAPVTAKPVDPASTATAEDTKAKSPEVKPEPPKTEPPPVFEPKPKEPVIKQQPTSGPAPSTDSHYAVPAKKSSTGLIVGIVLVLIVLAVGAIKFFSGSSSSKKTEDNIKPLPQESSPVTPHKTKAPQTIPPSEPGKPPVIGKKKTPPAAEQESIPAPKSTEKPVDEQIQDAIALYDSGKVKEAAGKFKAILDVVPDNRLAKFYLQKCQEAGN